MNSLIMRPLVCVAVSMALAVPAYAESTEEFRFLDEKLAARVSELLNLTEVLNSQLTETPNLDKRSVEQALIFSPAPAPLSESVPPVTDNTTPMVSDVVEVVQQPSLKLEMIMASQGTRSAVIDGQFHRVGDWVTPALRVIDIFPESVVLAGSAGREVLRVERN